MNIWYDNKFESSRHSLNYLIVFLESFIFIIYYLMRPDTVLGDGQTQRKNSPAFEALID